MVIGNLLQFVWSKCFFIALLIIILISYGQMLGMSIYQDDNAIFFKLSHIESSAGFLGPGPFGGGAYKYTITPYIPIHYLFGYNTVAYYFFALILYFLATICVYFVFSRIINNEAGKISSFLYAAGYIASDGFIRLYNTITGSFTIIAVSVMFLCYWKLYQLTTTRARFKWYVLSLILFYMALEFGFSRAHYLVSIIILFEIIFLAFQKPVKSIIFSVLRLVPFILLFYKFFVAGADSRSSQVNELLVAFSKGEFFQTFGIITTFANVILPDWLMRILLDLQAHLFVIFYSNYFRITNLFVLISIILIWLLLKNSKNKIIIPILIILVLVWRLVALKIFSSSSLVLSNIHEVFEYQITLLIIGGLLVILVSAIFFAIEDKRIRKLSLFLLGWIVLNISAYSAYMPLITYETTHRYLAHSFLPLVGLLGLLLSAVNKGIKKNIVISVVILYGFSNMIASFVLHRGIFLNRTEPTQSFYSQLKQLVPQINRGDVLYFDVANNARERFDNAVMVSQMPSTTAIAWRYGIDRYDFQLLDEFDLLLNKIKIGGLPNNSLHTFFYNGQSLMDTTDKMQKIFNKEKTFREVEASLPNFTEQGLEIKFTEPIEIITPVDLEVEMLAKPQKVSELSFSSSPNLDVVNLMLDYQKYKDNFRKNTHINTSSQWERNKAMNLLDGNNSTVWQADRIAWRNIHQAYINLDMGKIETINRIIWVSGFINNIPNNYSILASEDGISWKQVIKIKEEDKNIYTNNLNMIKLENVSARYLKVFITETFGKDSPSIAEIWVVSAEYSTLDLNKAEDFLKHPLEFIANEDMYRQILNNLNYVGQIKFFWLSDKSTLWMSQETSTVNVIYNGNMHKYHIRVPAGGTQLLAIKFVPITIPGSLNIGKILTKYPIIEELNDE